MVLDPGLLNIVNVTSGLKDNGLVVVNTKSIDNIPENIRSKWNVAFIDANIIARETLGVPIVNTTMLGALIRASGVVKLESMEEPVRKRFGRLAEKNLAAMKRAFEETQIKEMVRDA